jgi:ArsR family transcriptional regulator
MTIFDRLSGLADPTRSRLLLLLEGRELAVSELCAVLQLPQSTVSRHLRLLADDGWVEARSEGTTRQYAIAASLDGAAQKLWQTVRDEVADTAAARHDAERLRGVLAGRRRTSQAFFRGAAARWDELRAELFGRRPERAALPALLDERWTVGDLGCGTGQLALTLAPFVRRVIAVDGSKAMLAAARRRLKEAGNVELRHGELEALPIERRALDAAVLFLVLHYVAEPGAVIAEAARVLRPGGRLLVVDMAPHERTEYRQQLGHLWQGFGAEQLGGWTGAAGLTAFRYLQLGADPEARGPLLFAATARRS